MKSYLLLQKIFYNLQKYTPTSVVASVLVYHLGHISQTVILPYCLAKIRLRKILSNRNKTLFTLLDIR